MALPCIALLCAALCCLALPSTALRCAFRLSLSDFALCFRFPGPVWSGLA